MPRFGNDVAELGRDEATLLDVPTWDMVKATASEAFGSNPTEALNRRDQVQRGRKLPDRLDLRLPGLREDAEASRYVTGAETSPKLTQAQAQAKIDASGLTGRLTVPAEGENEAALDLLIQYKSDEVKNQFILGNYRGGVAGGAAQLAVGLGVSLVDPINIGSAFLPIVGEARYAQMLGRAGQSMSARAGVRAGVGAVEGTAGAALVEPMIYQSKQAIQADYGTVDSLMNIGFGSVFGGTLQPAAGAFGDVLARRAGTGAWAENIRTDMTADDPPAPSGFTMGGGTRYIEGDDYVRGQWAIADASTLRSTGNAFDVTETGQLGASPWSDSGAPVVDSDGAVRNGNRRMASILRDYEGDGNSDYRSNLIEQAEQYGLDSDAVMAMDKPVLVRVEGTRDVGAWGEYAKIAENSPQARAARVPFESPDTVSAVAFQGKARGLGVDAATAEALTPVALRDDVTGFYEGQIQGMKSGTVQRAIAHAEKTGEPAVYVSADVANLGGINKAMNNVADDANVHFRAMADILRDELERTGADVVPMRTGGDELGAVVVNADMVAVGQALERAQAGVAAYLRSNGLDAIENPKGGEIGSKLHMGMSPIEPGRSLADTFRTADLAVNYSKNGGTDGITNQIQAARQAGAGTSAGQAAGTGGRTAETTAGKQQADAEARAYAEAVERGEVLALRREIGWEQRGGELLRAREQGDDAPDNFGGRNTGSVEGRTPWVARVGADGAESQFWRNRPDRNLGEAAANEALDKFEAGAPLRPIEQRFIDHAKQQAAIYRDMAREESQELGESMTGLRIDAQRAYREERNAVLDRELPRLTEEQQQAATQIGVAQAVNGGRIDVAAVGELDGTTAGVERFLEAKRVADAAEAAARDRSVSEMDNLRRELERYDPDNSAALDRELADMEATLREQVRAAGGDEADIDAALAEVADITEAADTEAKSLRGVALCMLRSV